MKQDAAVSRKTEQFFAKYPLKQYAKGEILIHAGENPDGIYYLVNGNVQQYDISQRGDEVVVNVFKPKAFFPMSWAINKTSNQYFFEAVTPAEVRQAPPEHVVAFLREHPDVALDLLSRLYSGVDGLLRRTAHLMGGSAGSRLLFELLTECKRFGKQQPDGSVFVPVTESGLAKRAGMTRETVSRQVHVFKKQGLVSVARGGLVVKDIKAVETRLGSEL